MRFSSGDKVQVKFNAKDITYRGREGSVVHVLKGDPILYSVQLTVAEKAYFFADELDILVKVPKVRRR